MSNMPPDFNNYNPNQYTQQPPPKSNKTLWIILGVIFGLLILCCGGFVAASYFGAKFLGDAVSGLIGEGMKETLNSSPELQTELGEIETITFDFNQSNKEGKPVLNVKGSKGSGIVILGGQQGEEAIENAVLRLPDGREIPLTFPDMQAPNVELPAPTEADEAVEEEPAAP